MASSISEAQAELISSLSPDDIPIKLRCAICSKLAVDAFRLPCCEQAICVTCHSDLPQSCPVCEHTPLAAEDCNPNKSLRTTIRVFLRTAEKKREANRPKESKDSTPATPVEAPKPSRPATESIVDETAVKGSANGTALAANTAAPRSGDDAAQEAAPGTDKALATRPDDAGLSGLPRQKDNDNQGPHQGEHDEASGDASKEDVGQQSLVESQGPEQAVITGHAGNAGEEGTDQSNYAMNGGGFPNMMFPGSGDFSQMQMMMAMQNGMGNASYGGFPMMSMGMDPMTMQSMYMNGGFQGMGMNGMGGYGGDFGQGSNNNWNGSQSWGFDQNNYNQSGLGMGTGDYGDFNAGFQTGYNQGNYGHFADYRRNNFGRGRGRGRGYYGTHGRGGFQQQQHGNMVVNSQDQAFYSQQGPGNYAAGPADGGAIGDPEDGKKANERGRSLPARSGDEGSQGRGQEAGNGDSANAAREDSGELASRKALGNEAAGSMSPAAAAAAGTTPSEPAAARSALLAAPDVPINAPKGPKAMRQGLPNTSLHRLRARGYQVDAAPCTMRPPGGQQQATPDNGSRPRSRSLDRENDKAAEVVRGHSRERSVDQATRRDTGTHNGQDQDRGREPSRSGSRKGNGSPSRSLSRGHKSTHRHRRCRSPSSGGDGDGDGHRRKKHRSGRKHHGGGGGGGGEHYRPGEDRQPAKSRSASPDESRKSSHRGHKDKDSESRRDRDKHRGGDDDGQKSGRRLRRSRDRERDRDREHEHSRRRDKDRKERKGRYRGKDRHGSRSRRPSADGKTAAAAAAAAGRGLDAPSGPRGSSSRASHDRSDRDRHGSHGSASKATTPKDPHTLEREARNRERLLKEAQRMAGLAGQGGAKRGRDEGDEGGRKSRRSSRRSEAQDGDEERMRRLEAEREGGRWG